MIVYLEMFTLLSHDFYFEEKDVYVLNEHLCLHRSTSERVYSFSNER